MFRQRHNIPAYPPKWTQIHENLIYYYIQPTIPIYLYTDAYSMTIHGLGEDHFNND